MARQTCDAFEVRIIEGMVSKDHVHILVSIPPELAPSEIMRRVKGRTARPLPLQAAAEETAVVAVARRRPLSQRQRRGV